MAYIQFHDISQWQGNYNMAADPNPIIMMKMSGGDAGLYFDSKAAANYVNAKNAGKAVGMYHFAGGGNAIAEADFFVKACSPLEEADVLCLDWEVSHPDPVGWCTTFVNRVHDLTGVWPLLYINLSTLRAHNWSPVLNNCGLWVAAWGVDPNNNLATGRVYVAHQYQGSPLDTSAWFGTVEQFKKYGYHKPVVAPAPTPIPAPEPIPVPQPTPTPVPVPTPTPEPIPPVVTPPVEIPTPPKQTLWDFIVDVYNKIKEWAKSFRKN